MAKPEYLTIERAAERLQVSAEALRARCRRIVLRQAQASVVELAPGIAAIKFGRTWRVRFGGEDTDRLPESRTND